MNTGDWLGVIGIVCTVCTGAWFIIMQGVDNKIAAALDKLKDDRIKELQEKLEQERRDKSYLQEKIKDLK